MFRGILTLLIFLAVGAGVATAQNQGTGPKEASAREELRIRKQQKREAREKRKLEKAEKKKIKAHHKRIQTKKVQKRMKESRKRADLNNANKREFFVKRWFNKKGTKKGKPARKKD